MKVQQSGRPNVSQLQDRAPVSRADEAKSAPQTPSERVEVSNLSKLLSSARNDAEAPNGAERVERLRESIRVGEFKVDHEKVAEAMIREEV
jgi:flagellar biosynthesis anti-sigma factor FlgM